MNTPQPTPCRLALAISLSLGLIAPAQAANRGNPVGSEFRVNSFTTNKEKKEKGDAT